LGRPHARTGTSRLSARELASRLVGAGLTALGASWARYGAVIRSFYILTLREMGSCD